MLRQSIGLGPSPIQGVGVFAARSISEGTNVFATDQRRIRWVDETVVDALDLTPFQQSLYEDFAIRLDGKLGCPETFNHLSVGWYVNEPEAGRAPNLRPTADFNLVAARDIAAGEELTLSYAAYSDVAG